MKRCLRDDPIPEHPNTATARADRKSGKVPESTSTYCCTSMSAMSCNDNEIILYTSLEPQLGLLEVPYGRRVLSLFHSPRVSPSCGIISQTLNSKGFFVVVAIFYFPLLLFSFFLLHRGPISHPPGGSLGLLDLPLNQALRRAPLISAVIAEVSRAGCISCERVS